MGKTKIEWTTDSWQVTYGCSVISLGCTNCYAMRMAARLERMGQVAYTGLTTQSKAGAVWNGTVRPASDAALMQPLRWKRPRRIFVDSMADLFAEGVEDAWIDRAFAIMALCPQHTFQVLTKRPERMREYLTARNGMGNSALCRAINAIPAGLGNRHGALEMPLPNVWLGTSCEDQQRANERIQHLLATPAAVRFLSCEPMLGPIDLTRVPHKYGRGTTLEPREIHGGTGQCVDIVPALDWVIAGNESGPHRRPGDLAWMRSLRDQCATAGVAFYAKQDDKVRMLPADLMVREFPEARHAGLHQQNRTSADLATGRDAPAV